MLEPESGFITCPNCGKENFYQQWSVIPDALLPEVAEAVRSGSLFEKTCEFCGFESLAAYECLYHALEDDVLFLLEPSRNVERGVALLAQKTASMEDAGKACEGRLVFHPDRLCEKVNLLYDGLDDRAVELLKYEIKEDLIGQDALFETADIYYGGAEDEALTFEVFGIERLKATVPMDEYEEWLSFVEASCLRVEDFRVDENWAKKVLIDSVEVEAEKLLWD